MSIAKNLFDIVTGALAERRIDSGVEVIHLRIGKLRAIDPANLEFCFKVISMGSILEKAEIRVEEMPVQVKCSECHLVSEITSPSFLCPGCGSGRVELMAGKELEVTSLEISDEI
jgi:hydrogenase nickel incorporation protein HypA/HybF